MKFKRFLRNRAYAVLFVSAGAATIHDIDNWGVVPDMSLKLIVGTFALLVAFILVSWWLSEYKYRTLICMALIVEGLVSSYGWSQGWGYPPPLRLLFDALWLPALLMLRFGPEIPGAIQKMRASLQDG